MVWALVGGFECSPPKSLECQVEMVGVSSRNGWGFKYKWLEFQVEMVGVSSRNGLGLQVEMEWSPR